MDRDPTHRRSQEHMGLHEGGWRARAAIASLALWMLREAGRGERAPPNPAGEATGNVSDTSSGRSSLDAETKRSLKRRLGQIEAERANGESKYKRSVWVAFKRSEGPIRVQAKKRS